jgi:hypothetical protein
LREWIGPPSEHTLKKMKKQATMGIKKTPYVITHAMSGAYPPMRSGTAQAINRVSSVSR